MFPFGNSDNNREPMFRKPSFQLYDEIQNPISKHDDSPFFSNFPSPFFDEHELPLNQIFQTDETTSEKQWSKKPEEQPRSPQPRARKRTGKKDRHSKIRTAQGIRDRRMRLSLQVARKFFDLQDMLGYDKASKTIEWLFNKSNKAIKDINDAHTESFVSECEVMSENEENSNDEIKEDVQLSEHKQIKSPKTPRKAVFKPNTRDSREKARERARCRTEEKLMMGKQQIQDHEQFSKSSPNCDDLEKLGLSSSSPFDDQERVSPHHAGDYTPLVYQPSDVGTIENLLGDSSSSASNRPISCFIDPNNMGCFRNWDCLFSNEIANIQASIVPGNPNSIYSDTTPDFPLFRQ